MGGDAGGGGFGAFESFDSVPTKVNFCFLWSQLFLSSCSAHDFPSLISQSAAPSNRFFSSPPSVSNPSYASPNLNTDPWGATAGQNDLFGDLAGGMGAGMSSKVQKDDAFSDIWK